MIWLRGTWSAVPIVGYLSIAIRQWMRVRGYGLAGPKREIYRPGMLEIQFPLSRSETERSPFHEHKEHIANLVAFFSVSGAGVTAKIVVLERILSSLRYVSTIWKHDLSSIR